MDAIHEAVAPYDPETVIVIGNGGSVTSFRTYYAAFEHELDVSAEIVTTMEPAHLRSLRQRYDPADTLIMPISKSGNTVGVIETLLYFLEHDYPTLAVTSDNDGALRQIVSRKDLPWVEHPDIGGRFTGATETALVPAAVCGMDIDGIRAGAEAGYRTYGRSSSDSAAMELARGLYAAEQNGYRDLFAGVYSMRLGGSLPLLIQLMHETVCKDGAGQTVYGDVGPEFQHHTNQRIFGGTETVVPLLFSVAGGADETISVPPELANIPLRGEPLGNWQGRSLADALDAEYEGVRQALVEQDVPHATVQLDQLNPAAMGELVTFYQYLAVYSAVLREVDPFTQPDVELSKQLGMELRR